MKEKEQFVEFLQKQLEETKDNCQVEVTLHYAVIHNNLRLSVRVFASFKKTLSS